ncbi:MAG: arylsulfatase A-like enzyme [Hyphomicrobiaceae bacterium]
MNSAKLAPSRLRLLLILVLALLTVPGGRVLAQAADPFSLERHIEVKLAGVRNAERPYTRTRIANQWREVLGSTGRLALERRSLWVGPGGRLFVAAEVPEALASTARDLDVFVLRDGAWEKRGELRFEPSSSSRVVSRTLVLPDLPEGAIDSEVHVRGVHRADWQELTSAPVPIPKGARLRMGFGLEGVTRDRKVPVEIVIGAQGDDGTKKVLFNKTIKPQEGHTSWREADFSLSAFAGSDASFVFRSRPASDEGPAPGVVWGAPEVTFEIERKPFPVLTMVSVDSLRTGSLGIFGAKQAPSPFIDKYFGKQGAAFTRALSSAVTTLPAHMSLMTSLNPSVHGVTDENRTLAADVPTLATLLKKAGWTTVAFTDGGALAGEFGFARGFDRYDEGGARFPPAANVPNAVDRATAFLREYQGGPIFVFIHTYATRPFTFTAVRGSRDIGTSREYRSRVLEIDSSLELYVKTALKVGVRDRSFVTLTSGHGEEFGEHGGLGHGTQLYEESIRVPWLIAGGPVRGGQRVEEPVGLVDIAPTLLGLVGVEVPSEMQGRSLATPLKAGYFTALPYRFTEAHRGKRLTAAGRLLGWHPPAYAVREGHYKVIMNGSGTRGTTFEAYDLSADPAERRNLAGRNKPDWASRLERVVSNYPNICRRLQRREGPRVRLDANDAAKLRTLGYR